MLKGKVNYSRLNKKLALKYVRLLKNNPSFPTNGFVWWRPFEAEIEITDFCNLRCKMCYGPKRSGKISFDVFRKIIDRIDGVETLHICGTGEPLLNNNIYKMIKYCKKKQIPTVTLTTNGMLLNEELSEKLNRSGLNEIRISLDAGDEETLKSIRPGSDFSLIIKNIKYFVALGKVRTYINSIILPDNWDSLLRLISILKNIRINQIRFCEVKPFNEQITLLESCQRKDRIAFLRKLRKSCNDAKIDFTLSVGKYLYCVRSFTEIYIDHKGNVTPCCTLVNSPFMGNILKEDLDTIWNSSRMKKWRVLLQKRQYPKICKEICRV